MKLVSLILILPFTLASCGEIAAQSKADKCEEYAWVITDEYPIPQQACVKRSNADTMENTND